MHRDFHVWWLEKDGTLLTTKIEYLVRYLFYTYQNVLYVSPPFIYQSKDLRLPLLTHVHCTLQLPNEQRP